MSTRYLIVLILMAVSIVAGSLWVSTLRFGRLVAACEAKEAARAEWMKTCSADPSCDELAWYDMEREPCELALQQKKP